MEVPFWVLTGQRIANSHRASQAGYHSEGRIICSDVTKRMSACIQSAFLRQGCKTQASKLQASVVNPCGKPRSSLLLHWKVIRSTKTTAISLLYHVFSITHTKDCSQDAKCHVNAMQVHSVNQCLYCYIRYVLLHLKFRRLTVVKQHTFLSKANKSFIQHMM